MNELTPEEALEVCGPDWSKMTDTERYDYGPRPTLKGRAERTRQLIALLARDWVSVDAA